MAIYARGAAINGHDQSPIDIRIPPSLCAARVTFNSALNLDDKITQEHLYDADQPPANRMDRIPELDNDTSLIGALSDSEFLTVFRTVIHGAIREAKEAKVLRAKQTASLPPSISIFTMYKPKSKKVHPVDDAKHDGSVPPGSINWKEGALAEVHDQREPDETSKRGGIYSNIYPRFATQPRGTRLTKERLQKIEKSMETSELTDQEKELLVEVLHRREMALAWDFSEIGKIRDEIAPPYEIRTIPHKAWQAKGIPIPAPLQGRVLDVLKTRLTNNVLEEGHGAYRNAWFVVEKKDGGLRLINSATKLNAVTIRDAFLPRSCDEFAEEFAMCKILSVIDFFSGYDQVPLSPFSRALTAFSTPLGILQMTTLPQGATNSVAHFLRVVSRILYDIIPGKCEPFFDDVGVKGPVTRYNDQEVAPGVRQFILEHIENIDAVLLNFELAGATASGIKSEWCRPTAILVGYLCGTNGRKPVGAKVLKILEWTACSDVTEVRAFLGISGYYRTWVKAYAIIALPLTMLLRHNIKFVWGDDQKQAMTTLQQALTTAPCLITLDYEAGEIWLKVDASGRGWGAILCQLIKNRMHPSRYESGTWRGPELNYDATKKECLGVVKALRRLRNYLYGIRFHLETDAKVLIAQLNDGFSALPGAVLTRWVAFIKMFDFELHHVPGKKHTAADGLSRKPEGPSDKLDDQWEGDIEDFIDLQLHIMMVKPTIAPNTDAPLKPEQKWSTHSQELATYLTTGSLPDRLTTATQRRIYRNQALQFFVYENCLWKRTKPPYWIRRCIDNFDDQKRLLQESHIRLGHRGRDSTYHRIAAQYYWKNLYKDVKDALKSCEPCQRTRDGRSREEHCYNEARDILTSWVLDVQFMPDDNRFKAIVEARCETSAYLEAMPLRSANSESIARFIKQYIIYRHGTPIRIKCDNGSENKKEVITAGAQLGFTVTYGAVYYPQGQGLVESGHKAVTSSLKKVTQGTGKGWTKRLDEVIWADRTITRHYGYSAYEIVYGRSPVLPIENVIPTWRIINWQDTPDHASLLAHKVQQFRRREEDIAKVRRIITEKRRQAAKWADQRYAHKVRPIALKEKDLVLMFDTPLNNDKSRSAKLLYKWKGPFLIASEEGNGRYKIKEPGGHTRAGTYASDSLRPFVKDEAGYWEPVDPTTDEWTTGSPKDDCCKEDTDTARTAPIRATTQPDKGQTRPRTRLDTARTQLRQAQTHSDTTQDTAGHSQDTAQTNHDMAQTGQKYQNTDETVEENWEIIGDRASSHRIEIPIKTGSKTGYLSFDNL